MKHVITFVQLGLLWVGFFMLGPGMTRQQIGWTFLLLVVVSLVTAFTPVFDYWIKRASHHRTRAVVHALDGSLEQSDAHNQDAVRFGEKISRAGITCLIVLVGVVILYFIIRPF